MSYCIFGDFSTFEFKPTAYKDLKDYAKRNGFFLWFNESPFGYEDIIKMLCENGGEDNKNKINFTITSERQPTNAHDILFPFEEFDQDELFPHHFLEEDRYSGNNRDEYERLIMVKLNRFSDLIYNINKICDANSLRIFITLQGYEENFNVVRGSIDSMIENLFPQVANNPDIDSTIFEIVD